MSRGSARAPFGLGCCDARAPHAPPLGWDCAPFGLGCCDARAPHAPPLRPPCAPFGLGLRPLCAPYARLLGWAALRSLCARSPLALRSLRAARAARSAGPARAGVCAMSADPSKHAGTMVIKNLPHFEIRLLKVLWNFWAPLHQIVRAASFLHCVTISIAILVNFIF